jgi:hypothetical protein
MEQVYIFKIISMEDRPGKRDIKAYILPNKAIPSNISLK